MKSGVEPSSELIRMEGWKGKWGGWGGERIGGLIEVGRRRGGGGSKDFIKFVTEVLVS